MHYGLQEITSKRLKSDTNLVGLRFQLLVDQPEYQLPS